MIGLLLVLPLALHEPHARQALRPRVELTPPPLTSLSRPTLSLESAAAASAPPPSLLRLRGGDGGPMQAAQNAYFGLPTVTRAWLTLIIAFASLTQIKLLTPEALALDSQLIIKGMQIWRPITSASFLGGLGPQLLQKCYYLVQFGCGLERTLGMGEYARVLASSTAVLCIFCNLLGWQFTGDGLIMAITVLTCQQQPNASVNMYGLNIPTAYLPFAQMCMSYLFTQQIPWNDILGAIVGYINYYFNDNTKPDDVIYRRDNVAAQAVQASKAKKLGGGGGGLTKKTSGKSKKSGGGSKKARAGSDSAPQGATCGPNGCSL